MNNVQKSQDIQLNQEPERTFHDFWLMIRRGKFWIIFSVITVLALTVYYNYSVSPEYTATATLLITQGPDGGSLFDFGGGMHSSEISNQIALLQSRQVATATVKNQMGAIFYFLGKEAPR